MNSALGVHAMFTVLRVLLVAILVIAVDFVYELLRNLLGP
jgi:hypothetical protein